MTASYPTTIPSFTTKVDNTDVNFAADINRVQDEIRAIALELGVNPKSFDADVAARLAKITAGTASGQTPPVHNHDSLYFRRTLVEAKGDLLAGTSEGAVARVATGSTDQLLAADPAQTTGLRWRTITHSSLPSLNADDHPQYLTGDRHADIDHAGVLGTVSVRALADWSATDPNNNDVPRWDGTRYVPGSNNAATLSGATAAQLRDRATHTGTQTLATITGHTKAVHDALGLAHSSLSGLTSGNPHTQYLRPGDAATISGSWNYTTRPTVSGNNVFSTPNGGRNIYVQSGSPSSPVNGDVWIKP